MKKIIFSLISVFLFWQSPVFAAAIKITPPEIKIEGVAGSKNVAELIVENPGDNVMFYEAYSDDFSDWIKTRPASFILQGQESRKLSVEIFGKEAGVFFTTLSVSAKPFSDREVKVNAGLKVPLEIRLKEDLGQNLFLARASKYILPLLGSPVVIILLLALLLMFVQIMKMRRHPKPINEERPR